MTFELFSVVFWWCNHLGIEINHTDVTLRWKDGRFNSPPADVVTWPWGFGCRRVSVSQLNRWHRLCDNAWGPAAFARRFTGCSGTAEAGLTRDRFTHASLKWIRCGRERTLKSRLKLLTANKDWSLYLSLFVLIYCTNTAEQHFSTSEGQSVSMVHQYFDKWTREATPRRVCVANFATFTEKCDWVDDSTLKLKPR